MNRPSPRKLSARLLLALLAALCAAGVAPAQRREHLTPEEVDLVRDNQELDKRTGVFIKAAERRLLAITDPSAASKQSAKDREQWGEVQGSRSQLLYDLSKILDEAVVNIDDAAMHNRQSALLRKSLYHLSEAANRFLPQLVPLREGVRDEAERDQLEHAIETAQEIIEAAKAHSVSESDAKEKSRKKGN